MVTTTNQGWERDDLAKYRKDPDKLYATLQDVQTQVPNARDVVEKRASDGRVAHLDTTADTDKLHSTASSVTVWSGRTWVPAEVDYPRSYDAASHSSRSGGRSTDVLVYNCTSNELTVCSDMEELSSKSSPVDSTPEGVWAHCQNRQESSIFAYTVQVVFEAQRLHREIHATRGEKHAAV
jgi:hypothetical protein